MSMFIEVSARLRASTVAPSWQSTVGTEMLTIFLPYSNDGSSIAANDGTLHEIKLKTIERFEKVSVFFACWIIGTINYHTKQKLHKSALRIQIYCDFDKAITLLMCKYTWNGRWDFHDEKKMWLFSNCFPSFIISNAIQMMNKKTFPRIWPLNHKLFI